MTELWVLCPHQSVKPHWWPAPIGDDDQCSGGRLATTEECLGWLRGQGFEVTMTEFIEFVEVEE